jgi:hypothetical protein
VPRDLISKNPSQKLEWLKVKALSSSLKIKKKEIIINKIKKIKKEGLKMGKSVFSLVSH